MPDTCPLTQRKFPGLGKALEGGCQPNPRIPGLASLQPMGGP